MFQYGGPSAQEMADRIVATVDRSNRVALKTVAAGRDFGDTVEILSGLSPAERVVMNPPDSLTAGQTERVVAAPGRGEQR